MALNIKTELTTLEGIKITDAYARVSVNNPVQGNFIEAYINVYASKEIFESNPNIRSLKIKDLDKHVSFEYDYATGEKDILDLAHTKLIEHLAEQNITAEKDLV